MDIVIVVARPLIAFVVLVGVLVAVRRVGSGEGIGFVELLEAAFVRFAAPAPAGHAVPEPDFEPFRLADPAVVVAPATRNDESAAEQVELPSAA